MYITRIKLEKIRGFRELDLDLRRDRRDASRPTIIIGKNGTCKTTLLRCLVIGVCDRAQGNSLLAEPIGGLITQGAKQGTITLELSQSPSGKSSRTIKTILQREKDRDIVSVQEGSLPKDIFICGYGAGRSTEGIDPGRTYQPIDSTYSLFRYDETLIATELTLLRLRDYLGREETFQNTLDGIKKVLGLSPEDIIEPVRGGGVQVTGPLIGDSVPLEGWADGYRRTFNWILDLYAWAMRANKVDENGRISGIVLIDEPEQHTHPSMQMDLIPRLFELLPHIQIFATTHSPLVVMGVESEDLVVLKRKGRNVQRENEVPEFESFSPEDMLIDPNLFDTTIFNSRYLNTMGQYQALAEIPAQKRSNEQKKELLVLARALRQAQRPRIRNSSLMEDLKYLKDKYDL